MAVLLQEMLPSSLSFVLHTQNPMDRQAGDLIAELAPGMGETLAAGTQGTPWRLSVDKASGKAKPLVLAASRQGRV